jgi:hypothetical protein
MKVLSWDVGIDNLGYCLLEIDIKTEYFTVISADVICLVPDKIHCSFIKRDGDCCSNVANNIIRIDNNNKIPYCRNHIVKYMKTLDLRRLDTGLNATDGENKCSICKKKSKWTINTCEGEYCETHMKKQMKNSGKICCTPKCNNVGELFFYNSSNDIKWCWCSDHEKNIDDFFKKKIKKLTQNSNDVRLEKLSEELFSRLDEKIDDFLDVDEVLIENQPVYMNPTMKTISSLLYAYFYVKGINDKENTKSNIKNIFFCSPSKKLEFSPKTSKNEIKKISQKESEIYPITKQISVLYCTNVFMTDKPDCVKFINAHDRQHDMCDAFLQALTHYFIKIPQKYLDAIKQLNIEHELKEQKKKKKEQKMATKNALFKKKKEQKMATKNAFPKKKVNIGKKLKMVKKNNSQLQQNTDNLENELLYPIHFTS